MSRDLDGTIPPTIEDVAASIGISISTVSRALRNDSRVAVKTRAKVNAAARQLGYRPNPLISALMSHLRTMKPVQYQSTIAYLDTSANPAVTGKWPSARKHYEGVCAQAHRLGYEVERFWFHDREVSPVQLVKILCHRGIQGLIIHYLPTPEDQLHLLQMDLRNFAVASLGARMNSPCIHYSGIDHYGIMDTALRELRKLGYRRVGIAIDGYAHNIVEGRFSGAYLNWEETVAHSDKVAHFGTSDFSKEAFIRWFRTNKPEVVLCIDTVVLDWLAEIGANIPDTVGVVHLDWCEEFGPMTGIRQKHEAAAAAVVDLIVGQLNRNERGIPEDPKTILSGGSWIGGNSVRQVPS